jgi:hypothetical protein
MLLRLPGRVLVPFAPLSITGKAAAVDRRIVASPIGAMATVQAEEWYIKRSSCQQLAGQIKCLIISNTKREKLVKSGRTLIGKTS